MAKKTRTKFICQSCGAEHPKVAGRCHHCGEWGTITEEIISSGQGLSRPPSGARAVPLGEIETSEAERFSAGIAEFDRAVGGGIVPGSMILIGGAPGIGKSTLLLQLAQAFRSHSKPVLYVSGEESARQIKMRAARLGVDAPNLLIFPEINVELILQKIEETSPLLVFIDSIQTLYHGEIASAPGSVSQVRECASLLIRAGKARGITILFVGHVTKDGSLAGPRVLEHLVDTVLSFEGDDYRNFRILKAVKNRFGSTGELGIFEMMSGGLRGVADPSEFFLNRRTAVHPGTVVVPMLEGTRPFLVEIQSLVVQPRHNSSGAGAAYIPVRRFNGVDMNRIPLLLAVLEKWGALSLAKCDIFVSAAGGVEVGEPAADLGIVVSVASALRNRAVDGATVFLGEVGLGGEVRGVARAERRLREASRLGFRRAFIPMDNLTPDVRAQGEIAVEGVEYIRDVLDAVLPVKKE